MVSNNHDSNNTHMLFEDDVKRELLEVASSDLGEALIGVLSRIPTYLFEGRLQIKPKSLMHLLRDLGMASRNLPYILNSQSVVNQLHLSPPTCLQELIVSQPLLLSRVKLGGSAQYLFILNPIMNLIQTFQDKGGYFRPIFGWKACHGILNFRDFCHAIRIPYNAYIAIFSSPHTNERSLSNFPTPFCSWTNY